MKTLRATEIEIDAIRSPMRDGRVLPAPFIGLQKGLLKITPRLAMRESVRLRRIRGAGSFDNEHDARVEVSDFVARLQSNDDR